MWENGTRPINDKQIAKMAEALGVSSSEIVGNSTSGSLATVPVIGFIGAEGIVGMFDIDIGLLEREPCPPGMNAKKTTSYKYVFCDNDWFVFVEEMDSGGGMPGVPAEFIGQLCIVTIFQPNGEDQKLFKRVELGSRTGHYDLYGMDSSEKILKDCLVKSSLFVENMRQKRRK